MSETPDPRANRKHRILVAKPGLDGHDRGAKVVVRALTEAGYEVIYTGLHQEPEAIAEAALQEDVEAVGLSILSGAHMTLFPAIRRLLIRNEMADVLLFGGGIIPQSDIETLRKDGVARIFTPGTDTGEIVRFLDEHFQAAEGKAPLPAPSPTPRKVRSAPQKGAGPARPRKRARRKTGPS